MEHSARPKKQMEFFELVQKMRLDVKKVSITSKCPSFFSHDVSECDSMMFVQLA